MFWTYLAILCALLDAASLMFGALQVFILTEMFFEVFRHSSMISACNKRLMKFCSGLFLSIHDCNSLQYAICTLFAFGDLCLLYIWTHKRQAIWEYMQAAWFVKMIYSVTVQWSVTFLFSLLWCCKVVTLPFVQLHTRIYDRPTKIAKFVSTTCRGSKIDFFAVLTILCSIEWSWSAVGN